MNFNNATKFEGFIVPPNNQTSNPHVSSTYSNRARTRTKFLDARSKTIEETTMTRSVGGTHILDEIPNAAVESENRRTLHELLPPPPLAGSHVGDHQSLKIGNHEQEVPFGLNHFYTAGNPLLRSNQQMVNLCSTLEQEVVPFLNRNVGLEKIMNSQDFTTNQLPPSSSKGYESESLNMNVAKELGTRGALTESQLMELQNQNLIYSYISANMFVPPHLLNQSLCSYCFPPSSTNPRSCVDPEPGRCRRSDGKKWRCSNDAVEDEKYCEKHRSRGRIRRRLKKNTSGRKTRLVMANVATNTRTIEPGTSSTSTLGKIESGVYFKSLVNL